MMVLMGTETSARAASTPTDTQVGEPEQTVFDIRGDAAEAIREDATGITATATIGGVATTPDTATINNDGTVTITGITIAAATGVQDNQNALVVGQSIYPITNDNILNAVAAGQTITITAVGFNLNPRPVEDVTLNAEDRTWTVANIPTNFGGFTLNITVSIPEYVSAGVPIGNQAARTVVLSYDVPAFTREVENIYPADRCTWQQEPSVTGRGYFILGARFFNGMDATGFDIHDALLGFIGKSGRFVAISERE